MPRGKLRLAFIEDPATRKATYKKRKEGLLKKLKELTTLCNIEACAVLTNPSDPTMPVLFPSPEVAHNVVERYLATPKIERERNKVDLETVMRKQVSKLDGKLLALRKQNEERTMEMLLQGQIRVDGLSPEDLEGVLIAINGKTDEPQEGPSSPPALLDLVGPIAGLGLGGHGGRIGGAVGPSRITMESGRVGLNLGGGKMEEEPPMQAPFPSWVDFTREELISEQRRLKLMQGNVPSSPGQIGLKGDDRGKGLMELMQTDWPVVAWDVGSVVGPGGISGQGGKIGAWSGGVNLMGLEVGPDYGMQLDIPIGQEEPSMLPSLPGQGGLQKDEMGVDGADEGTLARNALG